MGNCNNGFIWNVLVFIAGGCGVFNIRTALRTLKYGTKIEELIAENESLKARLKEYEQRSTTGEGIT